jgi:hypothetical protein
MGQYYYPVILADDKQTVIAWIYSHDYGEGLKLMEHSWIGNPFVLAFEGLIYKNPQRVVWAGDYADSDSNDENNNVHNRCTEETQVHPSAIQSIGNYIVNHDKMMYVDKTKGVKDTWGYIHPLPLLTCEGNGRGGGDYRGNSKLVGIWARDKISIEDEVVIMSTEARKILQYIVPLEVVHNINKYTFKELIYQVTE